MVKVSCGTIAGQWTKHPKNEVGGMMEDKTEDNKLNWIL